MFLLLLFIWFSKKNPFFETIAVFLAFIQIQYTLDCKFLVVYFIALNWKKIFHYPLLFPIEKELLKYLIIKMCFA